MKIKIHNIRPSRKSKSEFFIRQNDLLLLALFGATFLIGAIDGDSAIAYLFYLLMGSICIAIVNKVQEDRKNRWPKY